MINGDFGDLIIVLKFYACRTRLRLCFSWKNSTARYLRT
jgi:hypothetical protein